MGLRLRRRPAPRRMRKRQRCVKSSSQIAWRGISPGNAATFRGTLAGDREEPLALLRITLLGGLDIAGCEAAGQAQLTKKAKALLAIRGNRVKGWLASSGAIVRKNRRARISAKRSPRSGKPSTAPPTPCCSRTQSACRCERTPLSSMSAHSRGWRLKQLQRRCRRRQNSTGGTC